MSDRLLGQLTHIQRLRISESSPKHSAATDCRIKLKLSIIWAKLMELMLVLRAVIAGSAMGATVEELRREVGKLKGHILSQVGTDAENNQVFMLQGEELMRVKKATVSEKSIIKVIIATVKIDHQCNSGSADAMHVKFTL